MTRKIASALILVAAIFFASYLIYHGLFIPVVFSEATKGPYYVVCEKHTGHYRNTGLVIDRIFRTMLEKESIMLPRGFGLYYDNPRSAPENELRSIVGCLLDGPYLDRINDLKQRYRIEKIPASPCLAGAFPYRSSFSIVMRTFKAYPRLAKTMAEKHYPEVPVMEIYDSGRGRIDYIAPIALDRQWFDALIAQ
jgi:hypothetical protein